MPAHDWTRVDAGLFHAFHHHWIGALCHSLNGGVLPPAYYALPEQKIRGPVPDVLTLRLSTDQDTATASAGALAVAEAPPRARIVQISERSVYARKADRIAVRHRHGQIVAVIEVVSPGNKGSINELRAFVSKVADLIQQGVHVSVIDLFPPSKRDPQGLHNAIWEQIDDEEYQPPIGKPLTVVAYSADDIKTAYVEPFAVGDELPEMPLFLEPELYVPVALEATYGTAWGDFPAVLKGLLEDRPAEG